MSFASAVLLLKASGASSVPHSGGTLYSHLYGVYSILKQWQYPDRVCVAGLYHSVYGTSFFKDAIFTEHDRERVQNAIGKDAERLAWIFCRLDRKSLHDVVNGKAGFIRTVDGGHIAVTLQEGIKLLAILWANALEQDQRLGNRPGARAHNALRAALQHLSEEAQRDLQAYYMPGSTIERLLGQEHAHSFDTWPNRILQASGPVERLDGLVSYTFEELVDMPYFQAKAFKVDTNGITQSQIIPRGHERMFYDGGYTIYWHSLRSPRIDEWVRALNNDLDLVPGATRVSAFASKRGPGLRPHYDLNDNIVCQAVGTKTWRIGLPTVSQPTVGYTLDDRKTPAQETELEATQPPVLTDTVEMQPGDVMFMPRGYWHDTETPGEESLHFNIQCGLATWRDVILYLVNETTVLHKAPFRESIRHLGESLDDGLRLRLQYLVGNATIDYPALERFIAKRRSA